MRASRSKPEMPSTRQWCALAISAKRPSSSPSTNQNSQSGFERSSFWEKIRPASRFSWRSEPGCGSEVWRTWYWRLKRGSSTHTGTSNLGMRTSFWRKRGLSPSVDSTARRMRSMSMASSATASGPRSKSATTPTCMCTLGSCSS